MSEGKVKKYITCINCNIDYEDVKHHDKCTVCKKEIDPYFEMSAEVVIIDIILGNSEAYRHLLMNKFRYGHQLFVLKVFLAIVIAEWSYRIKSTPSFKNDIFQFDSPIFSRKNQGHIDITPNAVTVLIEVTIELLIKLFVNFVIAKIIYSKTLEKRKINHKQIFLSLVLSQAVRIALLLYLIWDDPEGTCYRIIAIFSYFSVIISLRGLFESKHFILPLIVVAFGIGVSSLINTFVVPIVHSRLDE